MAILDNVKTWIKDITEVGLSLIALGVVAEIIFGSGIPFVGGIVANLTALIATLGGAGVAGLIALAIILYLFKNK